MQRYFFCFLIATSSFLSVIAQMEYVHPHGEDMEYMTDDQWNDWARGFVVNGNFVKNSIGIPTDLLREEKNVRYPVTLYNIGSRKDSLVIAEDPRYTEEGFVKVGNFPCARFTFYTSGGVSLSLLSLDEIRRKYCPEVPGTVVYMINKFFITKDADLYRVAGQYIYRVETLSSKHIESISALPEFTVIRIFTRTPHNMHFDKLGY